MTTEANADLKITPPGRRVARRWLIELVVVLALAGGIGGLYGWSVHRQTVLERACERQRADTQKETAASLDVFTWGRAEAVFRAYTAGIHAAVLAGRKESLEQSVEELVRLPGVAAVHLLEPDGSVITSSDRKMLITGQVGARGTWALGTQEFAQRAGDMKGTTELAMQIQDAAGVKAVLWMVYDTERIKAQLEKASLPQ